MDNFLKKSSYSKPIQNITNGSKKRLNHTSLENGEGKKKKVSGLSQTFLSLGQKDAGGKECSKCGMLYNIGIAEEEKAHKTYCLKMTKPVEFRGWKNENVVWKCEKSVNERIVSITFDTAQPVHLAKIDQIKKIVDEEMGFYNGDAKKMGRVAYIYIKDNTVVALLIVEPLSLAHHILDSTKREKGEGENEEKDGPLCFESTTVEAQMGVSQIWVHNNYRRLALASQLLDAARCHFIFRCSIPKDKIAFTFPTPDGRAFAEKYTKKKCFLVYKD